jgi:hypothetical protein
MIDPKKDILIITLRVIAITIGFFLGILMIRLTRKIKSKEIKRYFLGTTEFFIVYSIVRTFFLLNTFFEDPLQLIYYIGNTLGLVSIVVMIIAIESTIFTKSKHFFTYYGIAGIGVMVFDSFARIKIGGRALLQLAQYVCMIPLGIVILLIYLSATLKSTGKIRKNGFTMFMGILLLMLSEMGNTGDAVLLIGDGVHYVAPIILVTSLLLLYYSVVNAVEMEESEYSTKSIAKTIILTKPPKITEEEIAFYKEKTICLVCKGKLEGFGIFLCGGCKSLYCESCARTLIDLENACWACNSPIDKSKPVKFEEPEKPAMEEIPHKKSKI